MTDPTNIRAVIGTLIGGVLIYVIGRIVEKFVLEPIVHYRKALANISYTLIFYSNIYSNPTVVSKEQKEEVSNEIRKLAADLFTKSYQIGFHKIVSALKIIPSRSDSLDAAIELMGISNSVGGADVNNAVDLADHNFGFIEYYGVFGLSYSFGKGANVFQRKKKSAL